VRAFLVGANPRRTAIRIAILVATATVVFGYILLPVRLVGISMEPTYNDGAFNFANRLAFAWRQPARGDVVAIRMAGPSVLYVKRIVGLPGEQVAIDKGIVTINGEPLAEPTVVHRAPWILAPVTLGRDEYFLIGDNRAMSMRNHDFGTANRNRIIGKLLF
jgi:signal peptidase I